MRTICDLFCGWADRRVERHNQEQRAGACKLQEETGGDGVWAESFDTCLRVSEQRTKQSEQQPSRS